MENIDVLKLEDNIFDLFKNKWGALTVKCDDKVNALTVSWIQAGQLWNKDVVTVYVRPQRYSYEFINESENLSLAFFDGYKDELNYLGSVSGKDEDKLKNTNLDVEYYEDTPYIKQANTVFILKKLYAHDLYAENFTSQELPNKIYAKNDFHRVYICEIVNIIKK